jgi:[CysO sulfur-carrier protein]-S-L-cysteine hydrolase
MSDEAQHPWIRGGLRITRAVVDRADEEARQGYSRDEESCGLMVGPAADALLVDEIIPMENRANKLHRLDPALYPRTGRMYFDVDPLKFERSVHAGAASGRPVKVLYHSHLDVGAYFSETDATAATMGGDAPAYPLAYLVTSVRAGEVDDRKLFIWDGDKCAFVESMLTIV